MDPVHGTDGGLGLRQALAASTVACMAGCSTSSAQGSQPGTYGSPPAASGAGSSQQAGSGPAFLAAANVMCAWGKCGGWGGTRPGA